MRPLFDQEDQTMQKLIKNIAMYTLVLAGGLAVGIGGQRAYAALKPSYTEGDYKAYFPDASTKVVLYGTPTCPYCAKARTYLKDHQISFVDHDLKTDRKALQEFEQLQGKSVPLILVGNRRIEGFDQAAVEAALKKIGSPQ